MTSAPNPIHLLVIDDDDLDQRQIARLLRDVQPSMHIISAHSRTEAQDLLNSPTTRIDAALLDLILPDADGLDFLGALPAEQRQFPIVILTGQGSQRTVVEAMKNGAADYLVKGDLSAERLLATLTNAIAHHRSEAERRAALKALERSTRTTRSLLHCAQTLMLDLVPSRTLSTALTSLLRSIDASSLSLWRHHGKDRLPNYQRWVAAGAVDILASTLSFDPMFIHWHLALSRGESVLSAISDLGPQERSLLRLPNNQFLTMTPFYLEGQLAGMLMATRDEAFSSNEQFFLQGAGDMLTAWIERPSRNEPSSALNLERA